jgi:hypothetical protein
MTTKWSPKICSNLHPAAKDLVEVYESAPGGKSYPGGNPAGIAAVLQVVAGLDAVALLELAALLRGEEP